MNEINIPNNIIDFILFQRSGYLSGNLIYRILSLVGAKFNFLYKTTVKIKNFLFRTKIKEAFLKDMTYEYEQIKPFLPPQAKSILDIGCGVAGIDIFFHRHYKNLNICLIDKTQTDKTIYYGFEKRGSFYNSLSETKDFLVANGIPANKVFLQEATDENEILFKESFDIVISLLSCGFHYPVETYLEQIYNKLTINGILILDLRGGTRGEKGRKDIERLFRKVDVISENSKYIKIIAYK